MLAVVKSRKLANPRCSASSPYSHFFAFVQLRLLKLDTLNDGWFRRGIARWRYGQWTCEVDTVLPPRLVLRQRRPSLSQRESRTRYGREFCALNSLDW